MVAPFDNLDHTNAFQRIINGTPLSTSPNARPSSNYGKQSGVTATASYKEPDSSYTTLAVPSTTTSAAASPSTGHRAPPTAP
ncbi:uncharacterized protein Z518_02685 [Rhinocladiella mackenziei CBS 650.93]|uniref:Rhinocladiella mackenziei CBS 650.93 unplaced genomic scaffold supercont1.2, whole genome shotgun sequence n=1 Tax=Rhinocladiella mackenziei CBS 650.93 TaxID=1442369 RepID=A0A0D2JFK3_9EURO|nr:uncharacterized protein Z518_02685 [Rhinocladiella mackenziei CBS 650.93]KIX08030.1 hypothetical protein Z518_02685 [Rhinocladiella mackenziei CBS 650.93]